jgi:hypothetical protein
MCVRCGTGRVAWCTDPTRHGEEPSAAGPSPFLTEEQATELQRDALGRGKCPHCAAGQCFLCVGESCTCDHKRPGS